MASLNRVIITGNLTADPEVKYLPSGTAVAKVRVAVNNNYKDKSGEWKEETCFVDVDVWGARAERINETCKKGSKVLIDGSLREDTWEDREGNKRSKIKIRAFAAEHIGEPRGTGRPGAAAPAGAAEPTGAAAESGAESFPEDTDDDLPF
jgi:single-strand DNA-binding protein